MPWIEDIHAQKVRRNAGRPLESPFPSPEVEEDFVVRGRQMIEKYYVSDPSSKNSFVFSPERTLSKTTFWSIIYIYYRENKDLAKNLQGFILAVEKYFGLEVSCDRASISKRTKTLLNLHITADNTDDIKSCADKRAYRKYNNQYTYVTNLWRAMEGHGEHEVRETDFCPSF